MRPRTVARLRVIGGPRPGIYHLYLFETAGGKPFREAYLSGEIRKAGKRVLGRRLGAHCFRHSWASLKLRTAPADHVLPSEGKGPRLPRGDMV